ncbi:glycosyltransferase [Paenibacillus glycanilyticus]|uniref:glycosyltransferase n=1 Tax=Paenibacillus glycanilyticus TaxID=126569 RepID=UPI00203D14A6|nr:glycosyltransferase [Paenibacillus glycanilyticus]MCM3627893.1 glycosyltransferase [Paenibacillus glycanilyticus]
MMKRNKRLKMTVLAASLALGLSLAPAQGWAANQASDRAPQQVCVNPAAEKLKDDLRLLWIDHAVWTRNTMISMLAGIEDANPVLQRLLRNQQDIGNAIKPYYGEEAGNKLAVLLKEHIELAGKVITAAKDGNKRDFEKYNKEWYRNADDIAKFLSGANPNWAYADLKQMLDKHLDLLAANLTARLAKDWEKDIAAYDEGQKHLMMLSDALAAGIVKQFPGKFGVPAAGSLVPRANP